MRYFLDVEFIESVGFNRLALLSVGLVAADGREFYVQNVDAPFREADEWTYRQIFPHLDAFSLRDREPELDHDPPVSPWRCRDQLCADLPTFLADDPAPEFWGYLCACGWVLFSGMLSDAEKTSAHWPRYCYELRQWLDGHGYGAVRRPEGLRHHALDTARWIRAIYNAAVVSPLQRGEPPPYRFDEGEEDAGV